MRLLIVALLIVLGNLAVAYLMSFYSQSIAIGWFFFAIGFQLGKWHGSSQKEEEFIGREEMIREEYE